MIEELFISHCCDVQKFGNFELGNLGVVHSTPWLLGCEVMCIITNDCALSSDKLLTKLCSKKQTFIVLIFALLAYRMYQ